MTHATKFYNKIRLVNLPDSFGEISYGYKNRTDLHGTDGFYKVIKPQLNENEVIDYNLENGVVNEKNARLLIVKKKL